MIREDVIGNGAILKQLSKNVNKLNNLHDVIEMNKRLKALSDKMDRQLAILKRAKVMR